MFEDSTSLTNILLIVSLSVNVITLLIVLRLRSNAIKKKEPVSAPTRAKVNPKKPAVDVGVVFCRNCGNQYESTEGLCPSCGTPR